MAEDGEDDLKNAASDRQDAGLGGNLEAIWPNLSRQRGFLGSKLVSFWCGSTEWRGPVEDFVFGDRQICKVI